MQVQVATGQWKSGLCDCCSTPACCMACCCPCCIYGQIAAAMRAEETCCGGNYCGSCCLFYSLHAVSQIVDVFYPLPPLGTIVLPMSTCVHCPTRRAIRQKYSIPGNDCEDCMIVWCCNCCALSQVYPGHDFCIVEWKALS